MTVTIDLGGVVGNVSGVCTQPRVTLPGGMLVQGTVPHLGASPLEAARATIGAINAALAPLGPVFSILDAVLAIIKFAQTVPKVISRPDKVVAAVLDVVEKGGALLRLVPQLSIPLTILGVVDLLITFLGGMRDEVVALAELEARIASALELGEDVPALGPVVTGVQVQVQARRAQLSCGIGDVRPLLEVVSMFAELIGLPGISLDVDPMAGSLSELATALDAVVDALTTFRAAIPIP